MCKKIYNQSNKTFIVGITKLLKPKHYTTISTEIYYDADVEEMGRMSIISLKLQKSVVNNLTYFKVLVNIYVW